MAQQPLTPPEPLDHKNAARIAASTDELLQWNKTVNALLQQENTAKSEQLFQNAASIAEAIRDIHPQSGNRSHVERAALDTYDHLVSGRVNYDEFANGALIGTGKVVSETYEAASQFVQQKAEDLSQISHADLKQKLEHTADSIGHAIDSAKVLTDQPEIAASVISAIPSKVAESWNAKLDHVSQEIRHGMRSANPGEELGIAAVTATVKELSEMRSRPIKVIEETVVGPIETAAKKYYAAHDELRSARKLAEHPDANNDAHHNQYLAQIKFNSELSNYDLSIQHKIQEARYNSPHEPDGLKSIYKNPIDKDALKDQLTPFDLDRLHSVSRHDAP